jgi:hypothetical protein
MTGVKLRRAHFFQSGTQPPLARRLSFKTKFTIAIDDFTGAMIPVLYSGQALDG